MIQYKNISYSAKTFYGVRFEPGETKSVPGFINSPCMIRVTFKKKPEQIKTTANDDPSPVVNKRGRKKSNEAEKDSLAETEIKIDLPKEETSNGNPS